MARRRCDNKRGKGKTFRGLDGALQTTEIDKYPDAQNMVRNLGYDMKEQLSKLELCRILDSGNHKLQFVLPVQQLRQLKEKMIIIPISFQFLFYYRHRLKSGPILLSNSQAGQDRKFTQPRGHF